MSYSQNVPYLTAAVAAAGALGGAYVAYRVYQERGKLPTEWKHVGTLKSMSAYPIKSCGPVALDKAELTPVGLRRGWLRDRFLMIVDQKNNFITARVYPELLLVDSSINGPVLTLSHSQMETIYINLAEVVAQENTTEATVWSCPVPVHDCGEEASDWFNKLLNRPSNNFRLKYYAAVGGRILRNQSRIFKFKKDDTGALPDETSYNIINESSVKDLNERLVSSKVSPRNFRPNFVISGPRPYEEDEWKFIKIGEHIFEIIKACTRCLLTTIDPETGARDPHSEPVETLKTYRMVEDPKLRKLAGNAPKMGLQLALRSPAGGSVAVNDPVYVA